MISGPLQIRAESFRSVLIEMLRCPDGFAADAKTVQNCETMAHGSAFVYRYDGTERLITEPLWRQHPTFGADIDIAEVPFKAPDDALVMSWERTPPRTDPAEVPWPAQVFPGEDVFIVGYPYGLTVGPSMPLFIRRNRRLRSHVRLPDSPKALSCLAYRRPHKTRPIRCAGHSEPAARGHRGAK